MTRANASLNRRDALAAFASSALLGPRLSADSSEGPFRVATFEADVTPPIGHPLMGGGVEPAKRVVDPLFARGLILVGPARPIVIAGIDWCEIRNDAYAAWRTAIASAAGTEPNRVLFSSLHQHDAPIADLEAERILERLGRPGRICDLEFHEKAVANVVRAVSDAAVRLRPVTHVGMGSANVDRVASNRRYLGDDGKPRHDRMSAARDASIRDRPEGLIDPALKTLSFWDGDKPVAAVHAYAVHPMSRYGQGGVSDDFVGLALRRRSRSLPGVFQMYITGCGGNVVAGKYNDGSPENRDLLAARIEKGMAEAWTATRREPFRRVSFRSAALRLDPRGGPGFTVEDLDKRLKTSTRPFDQCLAALGLSRLLHARDGATIDVPCVDFGRAQYLVLPGESYVEFQLAAQSMRPDDLVMVAGYGECSTGYVPTDRAFAEDDSNLKEWCWVAPGSDRRMIEAIRRALLG